MTEHVRLPGFFLIGAMKAGTTSLYEDLRRIDGIFLPPEKEPDAFINPRICDTDGWNLYLRKFSGAPAGVICGEASTSYAKLPTYPGVPERIRSLLGEDIRILYLTREPVQRMISQYTHLYGLGLETRSIDDALLNDDTYVQYSDYDYQISPWEEIFGRERVLVISFEEYVRQRDLTVLNICNFLGIPNADVPPAVPRNASAGKRVPGNSALIRRFVRSETYLYQVKPYLPTSLRDFLKRVAFVKARGTATSIRDDTHEELCRRLRLRPPTVGAR